MKQRYGIRFADVVYALDAGFWIRTIPTEAVLESMFVHFAPGSEGTVHLTPYIILPGGGPRVEILGLSDVPGATQAYLSGENYSRLYDLRLPLPRNSQIRVDWESLDAAFDHWTEISFEIDELGGAEAVTGGTIRAR